MIISKRYLKRSSAVCASPTRDYRTRRATRFGYSWVMAEGVYFVGGLPHGFDLDHMGYYHCRGSLTTQHE
ncbi:MAG: hypothetical protein AMS21_02185 [Gemmatimonas sp. SG8_38_2]|nr:MAG: hypothetical protein AMS21_02185 [Gemmatimonas sp. SG8_38_2]